MQSSCKLRMSLAVLIVCSTGSFAQAPQDQGSGFRLYKAMQAAASNERTLSADVVMTWNGGAGLKRTGGSILLMKPNFAVIQLKGDYPLQTLVSDGRSRFVAEGEKTYTRDVADPHGQNIDSPWWGLPFRFFFTQTLNPFGSLPHSSDEYQDLGTETVAGEQFHVLGVRGNSPMGSFSARFSFNAAKVLQRSSVQFGEGPGAAKFEAELRHIVLDKAVAPDAFRFAAGSGQTLTTSTDTMLALGSQAPDFSLPGIDGKTFELSSGRKGAKATLVNFWYYNCAPCRIEFPEFEKLYVRWHEQGLNVIAIDKGDDLQTVRKYTQKQGLTFPVALGGDVRKDSVFARYKVTESFPGTYLLDGSGKIVYRAAREDIEGLKQALSKLGFN